MKKLSPKGYEKLISLFRSLSGARSLWECFNDCINLFSLSFQNFTECGDVFRKNEEEYKQIIGKYKKEEQELIFHIFAELSNEYEMNPFQDLLGELYMRLDMGSKALGQFFTPYNLSQLCAEMMDIALVKQEIAENGYVTINEPSCGAGANIIAALEFLHHNGINYQKEAVVVCQDISALTAKMCHVALSFLGCQAVIKVGDTLANPFEEYSAERKVSHLLRTPFFVLYGGYKKV